MNSAPSEPVPANGRIVSAGMAGAAAVGLLLNHFFFFESQSVVRLLLLCLGPLALLLGIGGMIEPRIFWSVGKYGRHLPVIYKVIGAALGALGVAVTLLLVFFVYRPGPPEAQPSRRLARPTFTATPTGPRASIAPPAPTAKPERSVVPQEVMFLTYNRPEKRWVPMDEEALRGVRREQREETITVLYAGGKHPLLKVLWPDVLEVGDRFLVELQGTSSVELVDLAGADANARSSLPTSDAFVAVEIRREQDKITFLCDGALQQTYYASGKLRGADAQAALLATPLRPGFSVKKEEQAKFRNAQIVKP